MRWAGGRSTSVKSAHTRLMRSLRAGGTCALSTSSPAWSGQEAANVVGTTGLAAEAGEDAIAWRPAVVAVLVVGVDALADDVDPGASGAGEPRKVVILPALPKTAMGKIRRAVLRDRKPADS